MLTNLFSLQAGAQSKTAAPHHDISSWQVLHNKVQELLILQQQQQQTHITDKDRLQALLAAVNSTLRYLCNMQ
jgi:hypothetical protein